MHTYTYIITILSDIYIYIYISVYIHLYICIYLSIHHLTPCQAQSRPSDNDSYYIKFFTLHQTSFLTSFLCILSCKVASQSPYNFLILYLKIIIIKLRLSSPLFLMSKSRFITLT